MVGSIKITARMGPWIFLCSEWRPGPRPPRRPPPRRPPQRAPRDRSRQAGWRPGPSRLRAAPRRPPAQLPALVRPVHTERCPRPVPPRTPKTRVLYPPQPILRWAPRYPKDWAPGLEQKPLVLTGACSLSETGTGLSKGEGLKAEMGGGC